MKKSLLPLMVLLAMACAQERTPINRVQANALDKSFFAGKDLKSIQDDPEFYMRNTVIDVGYGAAQDGLFTSTYAQPVSRIRWEITEESLNARLSYERIRGTDGKGNQYNGVKQLKSSNDGQIVASYKILSHFDIKRAYNPTTGEAQNIVEENTADRPWYERQYFRIDWSSNQVTTSYDFDTLSLLGIIGGVTYEPMSFYVENPNDENAPHFETDTGYFDITTKAFARPAMVDLSSLGWGLGQIPACMMSSVVAGGTAPAANCNPVELTLRHSFRKVTDTDFEPFNQDGFRFQAFGAFDNAVQGYAQNYGMVDDLWYRFRSQYNVWQRSHYYQDPDKMTGPVACATTKTTLTATGSPTSDPNRDLDKNGTSDECEEVTTLTGVGGSQCDVFKKRCTLPYALRAPLTIPWYINGNTDEDLFEATNWAVQEWNVAMVSARRVARLVECRRTGRNDCESSFPMWTGQQDDYDDAVGIYREGEACQRVHGWGTADCGMVIDQLTAQMTAERGTDKDSAAIADVIKQQPAIVLCHNPVIATDHPVCGTAGLAPRLGDLRYHTVLNIPNPQTPSVWGIMVDADDPTSGEKVAASINIWSAVTDSSAQQAVDLIRYMNGELTTSDITDGTNISGWTQANRLANGGSGLPMLSSEDVQHRLASGLGLADADFAAKSNASIDPDLLLALGKARQNAKDLATRADVPSHNLQSALARLNRARGTATESALLNPAMLQLAGASSSSLPSGGALQTSASPLALNNPKLRHQLKQLLENGLARRGACVLDEAPEPSGLTGLADIMKKKFPIAAGETEAQRSERGNAMFRFMRRRYHYAVIAHEMGHSVGLRHNFVSSAGPLHYRPQYWQLRTKNGAVSSACITAVADGSTCVGPRYFDPVTNDEQNQLIWMFAQESAMDYPGDTSQDTIGLGIWDFGATRLFYGDTVAVYNDSDIRAGSTVGQGIADITDTFGGLFGLRYSKPNRGQMTAFHYSHLQKNWNLINSCYPVTPSAPSWWDPAKDGVWDALLDGHVVTVDGQASKCRQRPVDYVAWRDLRPATSAEAGGGAYNGGPNVDAQKRLRVPYHFATDTWADLGNISVFRHDAGGDPYEQAQFLITTQENRHILDNFRRNRTTFSVRGAADRSFQRYNDKLVGIANGLSFGTTVYRDFLLAAGFSPTSVWPYLLNSEFRDHTIAATLVFDHFTRQLSRPEDGEHFRRADKFNDPLLYATKGADGNPGDTAVVVPNGSTGYLRDIGFGGHPLENALSSDKGEYDVEYTTTAGSYYDKINAIIHLTVAEDRFISQSRGDFYDARFRTNGIPDLFPDGYRRVIANALTGDRAIMAPYLAADASGKLLLNTTPDPLDPQASLYPARPLGWTNWWPVSGPSVCFASNGRNVCRYDLASLNLAPEVPASVVPVDPELGWEVQKFVIANVLAYTPDNQATPWLDMLKLYRVGTETTPQFEDRIEWEDPATGLAYYAHTFGTECLFGAGAACSGGKIVQKGIAARVLEYASSLVAKGYKLDTTACPATDRFSAGFSKYGRACLVRQPDGSPVVLSDAALADTTGFVAASCDQNLTPGCKALTVNDNRFAYELSRYKAVPAFLWQALIDFKYAQSTQLGLFP